MRGWLDVIGWSHRRRIRYAVRLLSKLARHGGSLLDLGCGDGRLVQALGTNWTEVVGVDRDEIALRRAGQQGRGDFYTPREFVRTRSGDQFDVVVCMEVLEHATVAERHQIIEEIFARTSPEGMAIVSVPIEDGLSLLVKQFFRQFRDYANRHKPKEWIESYSWWELLRAGFGLATDRPKYNAGTEKTPYWFHGHKGFRWRFLEKELKDYGFVIQRRRFSPLPLVGRLLNSQVWLICKKSSSPAQSLSA